MPPKLGVNVDHVATLRQARRVDYPDPVEAALAAERAGADAITVHLREDRRHIQDHDLFRLRQAVHIHLNQELAPVESMLELALALRPHEVCIVPERREELTTEGGLDAAGLSRRLAPMVRRLKDAGIGVSLFIDPEPRQIEAAARLKAEFVEIHTGTYANLADRDLALAKRPDKPRLSEESAAELAKVRLAVKAARDLGLKPNAGHGLNYHNVGPIAAIAGVRWLHIGHSIVARAVMVGMQRAVREMKELIAHSPPRTPAAGTSRR
ncbi:MAG: pyridoxine 5'-phosphate synthase [Candidatus Binataceae bacterium]